MVWESTDNFGNLLVATSSAKTGAELYEDLESLCQEVFHRYSGNVTFSIDLDFNQISAPDGNQVSHVLTIQPGVESQSEIHRTLLEIAARKNRPDVAVIGPWD